MDLILKVLKKNGYEQAPWSSCPQGFEKSNWPCFEHKKYNVWVEYYTNENYGHVYHNLYPRGGYFNSPESLQELLNPIPTY